MVSVLSFCGCHRLRQPSSLLGYNTQVNGPSGCPDCAFVRVPHIGVSDKLYGTVVVSANCWPSVYWASIAQIVSTVVGHHR